MRRGDVVTVVFSGDYGKPRPAVVVQSDLLGETGSVILCPFTSDIQDAPLYRIDVEPSERNGLRRRSQLMIEKLAGTPRHKVGQLIGRLEEEPMERLTEALALAIGLLD